jgi:hypothetical protein
MNVPLRALSWAIRFFWIIALAVAVTCVYSATLIRVDFGEPIMDYLGEEFTVALPILFDNNGYYSIADLNITTIIADYENRHMSKDSTFIAQIPPQNNMTLLHNVSFNISDITTRAEYLFNDSSFTLYGSAFLNYANIIPFGFEANTTIPWGAPLFNFTAGMPEYTVYNGTHLTTNVPISFQNHSPYFSVTGTIQIEIFNHRQQLLGIGTIFADVPSNMNYEGEVETILNAAMVTERGQIRIFVETEMFNYGPMVINYG